MDETVESHESISRIYVCTLAPELPIHTCNFFLEVTSDTVPQVNIALATIMRASSLRAPPLS